jgi:hypothetical protein
MLRIGEAYLAAPIDLKCPKMAVNREWGKLTGGPRPWHHPARAQAKIPSVNREFPVSALDEEWVRFARRF